MTIELKPQIGAPKVRYIQEFLRSRQREGSTLRVLEWGAGGSTYFFAQWLQEEGIACEWTALEYDKTWYEYVRDAIKEFPRTEIVFFPVVGNPKSREVTMDEYVTFPRAQGKKYDLIFVDGRKRRRCLLEAKDHLAEGGIVLLHDAWRPRYHSAFGAYPTSRFLDRSLWLGSLETPSSRQRLYHHMVNTFFILRGRFRQLRKDVRHRLRAVLH